MSSRDECYQSQTSSRPLSQSYQQAYQSYPPPINADNPPPPPPKPVSQDTSRIGTPTSNGPARPVPPHEHARNSPRPQPPLPSTTIPNLSQRQEIQFPPYQPTIPPPSFEQQWLPTAPPLSSHTTAQLIPVLSDSNLLSALATTHPSHASSLQPILSALDSNVTAAQHLTQLELQLTTLRAQTQQLLLQHTTLSTQWRRKQSEMDNALSPWGPRAMYQRLVSAINEQENLVKAVQESFLEGDGGDEGYGGSGGGGGGGTHKASEKEVGEWIRRIREGTTTLERRREMRARWDEGRVGGWR